jgi:galactose mutarotase-like enzyme
MSCIYAIENGYLKVSVNSFGGCLTSIIDKKNNNKELLYQVDERSWHSQDVVIFPLVGRIRDGKYSVDGKFYSLKSHGVARYSEFEVKEKSKEEITLSLIYSEESLLSYPFKFELNITYSVKNNVLNVIRTVKNLDDKDIYFYIGSHPALKVSGKENKEEFVFNNVYLDFEKDIDTEQYLLNKDGNLLTGEEEKVKLNKILLTKDLINKYQTIIYNAKDINKVRLITKDYDFMFYLLNDSYLAVWSKPGLGDFVCVEPWSGVTDSEKAPYEISQKPFINKLPINSIHKSGYSLEINKK